MLQENVPPKNVYFIAANNGSRCCVELKHFKQAFHFIPVLLVNSCKMLENNKIKLKIILKLVKQLERNH